VKGAKAAFTHATGRRMALFIGVTWDVIRCTRMIRMRRRCRSSGASCRGC
jgi:hypothetical protein